MDTDSDVEAAADTEAILPLMLGPSCYFKCNVACGLRSRWLALCCFLIVARRAQHRPQRPNRDASTLVALVLRLSLRAMSSGRNSHRHLPGRQLCRRGPLDPYLMEPVSPFHVCPCAEVTVRSGQSLVYRHMGRKCQTADSLSWHSFEIVRKHFFPPYF